MSVHSLGSAGLLTFVFIFCDLSIVDFLRCLVLWFMMYWVPIVSTMLRLLNLQYYMRTGTCKFGASCKYHHPRQGEESVTPVSLNYYGYPLRPVGIPLHICIFFPSNFCIILESHFLNVHLSSI